MCLYELGFVLHNLKEKFMLGWKTRYDFKDESRLSDGPIDRPIEKLNFDQDVVVPSRRYSSRAAKSVNEKISRVF